MNKTVLSFIIIFLCLLTFQSCTQTKPVTIPTAPPKKQKIDIEAATFQKAEQLYQSRAYTEAIDMYLKYITRTTKKEFKDKALMKIGSIYTIQGKFDQATRVYKQLIKEHPDSIFASRAQLGLIYNDYSQKNYENALKQIDPAFTVTHKSDHSRLYLLKGDILLALDRAQESVVAYTYAYEIASQNEVPIIITRARQSISILTQDELQYLINVYQGRFPVVYMLYQQAQNAIKGDNSTQALSILNSIVETYTDHELIPMVQDQIAAIEKGEIFESYTIGCLLPLSGKYRQFGQMALNGALFAHSQFSTLQNVYPVQLKVQDSGETIDDAIGAFEKLLEENVKAIIGPITSDQAEAVALSANANQIPIILLTSREGITLDMEFVFRNFITQELQVRAIVSYAMDELGYHDFAILYPDDPYGQSYMDSFWDAVIEKNGTVRAVNTYSDNQTDFSEPIKKMVGKHFLRPGVSKWRQKKLKPIVDFDALFIPDKPDKIGMIAPQLKYHDINNVQLLGTNLWHSKRLIEISKWYVQNAVFPDLFYCDSQLPHVQQFVSAYEATFEKKPTLWEAITYDSAMILFELLNTGNIQYPMQLKDALIHMTEYRGLTGFMHFDTHGEAQKQLYLLKIKSDDFEEIGLR
ncbi:MAG: branched-chain amino acid ABC transporter periplasmic protein [Candidatus Magnetoglobus multicellularis str. Araruama]|uniref:Branched-chain amino acid ABC transporter periplasmic protein n=1 Tax=Candidatus Magnetoglobus multicellularis str. Araruama TaxID=890399 RepID=A0A1V1P962_9BACT|nr:MAG: branched-chain amino acid ABC transporter periplasmic protein [Candidatus Magnetoglobus multicellularis str. Araruama]